MAHFAVVVEQGPAWDRARGMREQAQWNEHAQFIDTLTEQNIILLAGPLGGRPTFRELLIVRAEDERTVRSRLAEDPWHRSGTLRIAEIGPWQLLIGKPG
jgi:uncharacterized protein YciI